VGNPVHVLRIVAAGGLDGEVCSPILRRQVLRNYNIYYIVLCICSIYIYCEQDGVCENKTKYMHEISRSNRYACLVLLLPQDSVIVASPSFMNGIVPNTLIFR
jgi:hypothetical protein